MTRSEVLERVTDALSAAQWARRAGWHDMARRYTVDAERWAATAATMARCGMPCLPPGWLADIRTAVYPPF